MQTSQQSSPRVVIENQIDAHDLGLYQASAVAPRVNGFAAIDDQALADYAQQGFLVIEGGLSPAEVAAAKAELETMTLADAPACDEVYYEGAIRRHLGMANDASLAQVEPTKGNLAIGTEEDHLPVMDRQTRAGLVRKFSGFVQQHAPLAASAYKPALVGLVERLAGGPVRLFQDMAMIKPAGGREKPWHQDHAYFNFPLDTRIVGVWIALGQVNTENGCMVVLSGGHHAGPRPHVRARDWQLPDAHVMACTKMAVPMEPGDILVFDAKLPHGTATNRTREQRWALQYHYVPQSAHELDDTLRLGAFGDQGRDVRC